MKSFISSLRIQNNILEYLQYIFVILNILHNITNLNYIILYRFIFI